jgi:hypothetical protein
MAETVAIDRVSFAFFARESLRPDWLDPTPIPRGAYWPRYHPLAQGLKHGIYIQPLTTELEHALTEKLSPEQEAEFHEAILAELVKADREALEASQPANDGE